MIAKDFVADPRNMSRGSATITVLGRKARETFRADWVGTRGADGDVSPDVVTFA
jgi:hypothetical protein